MKIKNVYNIEKFIAKSNSHVVNMLAWHSLRLYLNISLPIFYKCSRIQKKKKRSEYTDKKVIVSMTTFPARMKTLSIVLESLFRQTVFPDEIILWLADEQFSDHEQVEKKLDVYIKLGLKIRYCDDLRSHKKYFYTLKENPKAIIITVDDDIIYPEDMIEKLLETHTEYPNKIVCNRAHLMKKNEQGLLPYNQWNNRARGIVGPDLYLCPTGSGGCLYPPESLSEHVFDVEVLKKLCFYADDLWLKCMGYMKGTEVVITGKDNPEMFDIIGTNKSGLAQINVEQRLNDEQLEAITLYYNIHW